MVPQHADDVFNSQTNDCQKRRRSLRPLFLRGYSDIIARTVSPKRPIDFSAVDWVYFAAGFEASPWTMRSLSTLKTPGVELACMPAMALSLSLLTTP